MPNFRSSKPYRSIFPLILREKMLRNNGITGGSDSPVMVYNLLIKQAEKRDPDFKVKVKNIESSYQLSTRIIT